MSGMGTKDATTNPKFDTWPPRLETNETVLVEGGFDMTTVVREIAVSWAICMIGLLIITRFSFSMNAYLVGPIIVFATAYFIIPRQQWLLTGKRFLRKGQPPLPVNGIARFGGKRSTITVIPKDGPKFYLQANANAEEKRRQMNEALNEHR
ncbi:hypothetical protein [Amaricoccus tamworthensis]|uniref:hypothetical protein n=1 Tax=Amaricoccus tamworthensis TaxID=57002 RepID=UPI003C7C47FE